MRNSPQKLDNYSARYSENQEVSARPTTSVEYKKLESIPLEDKIKRKIR